MNILLTGAAGFIGFHVAKQLIKEGHYVIGVDDFNRRLYDSSLKYDRVKQLGFTDKDIEIIKYPKLHNNNCIYTENMMLFNADISDKSALDKVFLRALDRVLINNSLIHLVINLAAQAGVRYSITNPSCYVQSNIIGFFNVLECCRSFNINKVIYASSSSVYGNGDKIPFSEDANVNSPESLYAATKVTNEFFASVYNKIYGMSFVGLRFFTVYGPWGRPDMAPFLFTDAIVHDKPINVFGNGELYRDFTYIDDIVTGILKIVNLDFTGKCEVLNIGHSSPVKLLDFINILEEELGKKATKYFCGMQKGDVYTTYADTTKLESFAGYKPSVDLKEGIHNFVEWYKDYYKLG